METAFWDEGLMEAPDAGLEGGMESKDLDDVALSLGLAVIRGAIDVVVAGVEMIPPFRSAAFSSLVMPPLWFIEFPFLLPEVG